MKSKIRENKYLVLGILLVLILGFSPLQESCYLYKDVKYVTYYLIGIEVIHYDISLLFIVMMVWLSFKKGFRIKMLFFITFLFYVCSAIFSSFFEPWYGECSRDDIYFMRLILIFGQVLVIVVSIFRLWRKKNIE